MSRKLSPGRKPFRQWMVPGARCRVVDDQRLGERWRGLEGVLLRCSKSRSPRTNRVGWRAIVMLDDGRQFSIHPTWLNRVTP